MINQLKNFFVKINPRPIIVVGNQKSGTSAISHLLADYAGLSKTIDIPPLWGAAYGSSIIKGEMKFIDVVKKNKQYFKADLIKEPMMTFFLDQVVEVFDNATIVFIVRDPRSNIRSLLNSRNLPGNLDELTQDLLPDNPNHRVMVDRSLWGGSGNYISILANRWNKAVNNYFSYEKKVFLVKYEDFVNDKKEYIASLSANIGLEKVNEISHKVDIQYQPKGNREIEWIDFFGRNNFEIIQSTCSEAMIKLGYNLQ